MIKKTKNKQKAKSIRLYVVRHGDYGDNLDLSHEGITQITETANSIKKKIRCKKLIVFSSPQTRAVSSANLITKIFGPNIKSEVSVEYDLNCEAYSINGFVNRLAQNYKVSDAIIVSHKPDIERYTGIELACGQYTVKTLNKGRK